MKKISLKVKGMHCGSCEMLISDALVDAGAKKVEISHKTGSAVVEFDEKKLSDEQIRSTIKKEGYEVD